ncbi:hypothetical protein [Yoonia sp. BS5-3]|uniref:Uncharacterized protein n=1 Tax=Yoonia phaeophyticola TaxID=3137369 RepID=A0ABZ2VA80_9RHOB
MARLVRNGMVAAKRHSGWWASINSAKDLREMTDSTGIDFWTQHPPKLCGGTAR